MTAVQRRVVAVLICVAVGIAVAYLVWALPSTLFQLVLILLIVSFAAGMHLGQEEEAENWRYSARVGTSRYCEGVLYYVAAANDESQKRALSACLGMFPPNWVNTEIIQEEGRRLERDDILAMAHKEALSLALKGREADAAVIQALCKLLAEQRHVGISTIDER